MFFFLQKNYYFLRKNKYLDSFFKKICFYDRNPEKKDITKIGY